MATLRPRGQSSHTLPELSNTDGLASEKIEGEKRAPREIYPSRRFGRRGACRVSSRGGVEAVSGCLTIPGLEIADGESI